VIKDSNNTVESAIFKDIGFPSGNAIFVAAKESSDSQNPDSITSKWILVTSLDTEEAFKAVLSLRNLFIFITLIVLAISIIAIYIVVDRTISIPLTRLKDGAIEIGKGNLDFMITPSSTIDEIGELSSQFGKMRARIKARTEELMRRDKELEKANEELKSLDRLKDEFINVAAHELRTPIQPVLTLTQIIRSKIKDTELLELLDNIIRNAKRLSLLAEDILDITRIESQSLKLNRERFDLNDLISTVVQDHRKEIEKDNHNITLLYESEKDINFLVEADRYRIIQVISNLLDNAVKFTKEGSVSVALQKKKDNQQDALVSVKDTGTGIHTDILPRLFSKFATKSEKGTGLGLFISKSIVEAHGGRMWAENNIDGKGATFSFSLPLLDQHK
jgi:signal transduction histidine kinase